VLLRRLFVRAACPRCRPVKQQGGTCGYQAARISILLVQRDANAADVDQPNGLSQDETTMKDIFAGMQCNRMASL